MNGIAGTCTASAARPARQRAAVDGLVDRPPSLMLEHEGRLVATSPAAQSDMGGPPSAALSAAIAAVARGVLCLSCQKQLKRRPAKAHRAANAASVL